MVSQNEKPQINVVRLSDYSQVAGSAHTKIVAEAVTAASTASHSASSPEFEELSQTTQEPQESYEGSGDMTLPSNSTNFAMQKQPHSSTGCGSKIISN